MRRLDTLEALRGTAALLVVFYHLQDISGAKAGIIPFGGLFGSGDRGVDLFFVLSGFIIMTTHASDLGSPTRVLPYLYKRASRIFPSVWIMTLIAAATYGCSFGGAAKAGKLAPWNIVSSALLLPQTGPALVNVTWTLKYEIFFYAAFALLIVNRKLGSVLLMVWQGAVLLAALGLLHSVAFPAGYYLRSICLEFGVGMGCALLLGRRRRDPGPGAAWVAAAMVAAGGGVFLGGLLYEGLVIPHGLEPERVLVYGLGSGAAILGLTQLERSGTLRVRGPLVWLGNISYAVYLVHYSVIALAAAALLKLGILPLNNAVLLGCALLGVGAGAAFHHGIDQPLQAQLRDLGRHLFGASGRARTPAPDLLAVPQIGCDPRW